VSTAHTSTIATIATGLNDSAMNDMNVQEENALCFSTLQRYTVATLRSQLLVASLEQSDGPPQDAGLQQFFHCGLILHIPPQCYAEASTGLRLVVLGNLQASSLDCLGLALALHQKCGPFSRHCLLFKKNKPRKVPQ